MRKYEAIGIVEAKHFTTALNVIDIMCKQCQVELLCTEKYLGGRLVSTIVAGDISNVKEAIELVKSKYNYDNSIIKNAIVITRPHENIMKFIIKDEDINNKEVIKKSEIVKNEEVIKEDTREHNKEVIKEKTVSKIAEKNNNEVIENTEKQANDKTVNEVKKNKNKKKNTSSKKSKKNEK